MNDAEIVVPKSQALEELSKKLAPLLEQSKSLKVTDQASLVLIVDTRTSLKSYIEAVKHQTGPEIAEVKERLSRLKLEADALLNPGIAGLKQIDDKIAEFRAEERWQAQVEQDRKNAELRRKQQEQAEADKKESARLAAEEKKRKILEINSYLKAGKIGKREASRQLKAAGAAEEAALQDAEAAAEEAKSAPPPTVTVKPNLGSVAGAPKAQTYYFAEILDAEAILDAYTVAVVAKNRERTTFLRKFLDVDPSSVGKFARDTQDNEKATAAVPGVRFWSKG